MRPQPLDRPACRLPIGGHRVRSANTDSAGASSIHDGPSDAGYWTVVMPQFAVGMLMARKATAIDNP